MFLASVAALILFLIWIPSVRVEVYGMILGVTLFLCAGICGGIRPISKNSDSML